MRNVAVIGGGASGMMAAVTAARAGARVTLLERNEKLGKKLYITGKGRCNVTNAVSPEAFQRQVVRNPRFLFSALHALSPADFMGLLNSWGCPVEVERGERVFPQSQKASDVTRAFERQMEALGVSVRLNAKVSRILLDQSAAVPTVEAVLLESGERIPAEGVILCTGGKSYASTGSTGDGYAFLAGLGHRVLPAVPALVPLICSEPWVSELQGLSLKNVRLTLSKGRKTLFTDLGEMLFTHFGISGPLVLSASSYMAGEDPRELELRLDLKPGLTLEQLELRLLRDIGEAGKKQLQTLLCGLYPARLAETVPALCGLDGRKPANQLSREERLALARLTKSLLLPVSGPRPLGEAIITRGGLEVREVNPATMESKRVGGLYIAGELLDVDALTGGFNLHIAFATGYVAGISAARPPETSADEKSLP